MGMKVKSIIVKDIKTILSDKKALAIILIMPLILMVILSFALKGNFTSGEEWVSKKVNIAVVKQYDKEIDIQRFEKTLSGGFLAQGMGEEAAEELLVSCDEVDPEKIFFEDFLDSDGVKKIIIYKEMEEESAMEKLNSGDVSAVILLPDKFIYNMKINLITPFRNKVDIKVLTHPDRSFDGQIVQAVIEAYSNSMSSVVIGKNILVEAVMANDLGNDGLMNMKEVMDGISKAMESIKINIDDVTVNGMKQISSADYYAMAMMTMFILFAASHGGRMLLEEKENITYQRMTIAGISKLGILSGKFFTIFFIALLQIVIMITFSRFALKVNWGGAFSVIIISISAALAVAGVGVAIAAITYRAGNYKIANIFETAFIQTMALLGGSFFPIDIMPSILQKLSFLSLNGIALKAYQKTMMGYGTLEILSNVAILAGVGIAFTIIAVQILRGKGENADVKYHKIKALNA